MDLFDPNPALNLLPADGTVNYYGPIFTPPEARRFYETLLNTIPWTNDVAVIFGKRIVTARKVAWYGDADFSYTYSGTTKQALRWTPELLELKTKVEQLTGAAFNSCLLNLYHHGGEGMAWHSDDEKSMARNAAIASVSFGAERKFSFRHKVTKESAYVVLQHGSLLVMKDETQRHWQHSIPKTKKIHTPRINLTFRTMA